MAQAQQAGEPNRSQPKKIGKNKFAHTADIKYGMGDNYGTGIKQKTGRMREESVGMRPVSRKQINTPPKSLA